MRNIDVIYSLLETCRRADSLNARIGAIGKLEQLDSGDLCQLKNGTYFDQMRTQVFAAAGLLRLLTADYKRRLEEVDFSAGEFLMDTERVALASSNASYSHRSRATSFAVRVIISADSISK